MVLENVAKISRPGSAVPIVEAECLSLSASPVDNTVTANIRSTQQGLANTELVLDGDKREQTPTTIADLQSAIEAVLQETRTPGAGIAIVSRDKVEWVAGIGMADVAANKTGNC